MLPLAGDGRLRPGVPFPNRSFARRLSGSPHPGGLVRRQGVRLVQATDRRDSAGRRQTGPVAGRWIFRGVGTDFGRASARDAGDRQTNLLRLPHGSNAGPRTSGAGGRSTPSGGPGLQPVIRSSEWRLYHERAAAPACSGDAAGVRGRAASGSGLRAFLGEQLLDPPRAARDGALGRALGRVLAHELYHIFADTTQHPPAGVAKPAYSAEDLLSADFSFARREALAMRSH